VNPIINFLFLARSIFKKKLVLFFSPPELVTLFFAKKDSQLARRNDQQEAQQVAEEEGRHRHSRKQYAQKIAAKKGPTLFLSLSLSLFPK